MIGTNDRYVEKVNRGPGASSAPEWSPCGEMLGYLEMKVRGYESDRRNPLPHIPLPSAIGVSVRLFHLSLYVIRVMLNRVLPYLWIEN